MKKNIVNFENKTKTDMLINYLESVIVDEMILNSFIRDIKVIGINKNEIIISVYSTNIIAVLENNYKQYFIDGIKQIFEKELDVSFVLNGADVAYKNKRSKNISKKHNFLNYVVSNFNQEVINMTKKSIKKPGKFSPIFITSSSGLGKTHLLHSIGNEFENQNLTSFYIEPNKFTKDIIRFSKRGGDALSQYIESFNSYDVLLFDDIQNLGDRVVTLRVLFEILNTFIDNKKQIYIASDKSPEQLSGFEFRFITRFSSGLTTKINKPNVVDLKKIFESKLQKEGISTQKWDKDAMIFVVRNNDSSIRSIEGAIKRILFYTEDDNNIKYTTEFVSNIFKELKINPEKITPQRIIETTSLFYKINKNEIIGKTRKANVVAARHVSMWLVRKILDIPFMKIGKIFGGRDHSTVISSIKSINNKIAINNSVEVAIKKLEQRIRRVS